MGKMVQQYRRTLAVEWLKSATTTERSLLNAWRVFANDVLKVEASREYSRDSIMLLEIKRNAVRKALVTIIADWLYIQGKKHDDLFSNLVFDEVCNLPESED